MGTRLAEASQQSKSQPGNGGSPSRIPNAWLPPDEDDRLAMHVPSDRGSAPEGRSIARS